ncbi:uncharacterized protein FTOL_06341 [Fusarium torulosum]|uniref:Uncharacterized protein n=1 Tax=Fusarium torulosum TaxID=33205 RepID=A0AAE8M9K3_9HYPO|nr:uncharacterized protein FTOL_06341 [Fusarium torulosum]
MPRPTRRKQAVPSAAQSISNFTRVSKVQILNDSAKKITETRSTPITRKRKAAEDEEDAHPRTKARTTSFAPSSEDELVTLVKRSLRRQESVISPATKDLPAGKGKRTAKTTPSRAKAAHKPVGSTPLSESKRQGKTVQTKLDGRDG